MANTLARLSLTPPRPRRISETDELSETLVRQILEALQAERREPGDTVIVDPYDSVIESY